MLGATDSSWQQLWSREAWPAYNMHRQEMWRKHSKEINEWLETISFKEKKWILQMELIKYFPDPSKVHLYIVWWTAVVSNWWPWGQIGAFQPPVITEGI